MDFTGIVAEYDPFHNGHAAQLAAVRAAGAQCIAVCMSSGAVQRGGVPILPESVRVRAALDAGADLVVALPTPAPRRSSSPPRVCICWPRLAVIRWPSVRRPPTRRLCWTRLACWTERN